MTNLRTIPFILLLLLSTIPSTGQEDTTDYFLPRVAIKPSLFGLSHPFQPCSGLDVEMKRNSRYSIQAGLHYLWWEPECPPSHFPSECIRQLGGGKIRGEIRRYFFPKPSRSLHGLYSSLEGYWLRSRKEITNVSIFYPPDSLGYPQISFAEPVINQQIVANGIIARIGWQGATFRFGVEPFIGFALYHEWRRDETDGVVQKSYAMRLEPDFGFRIILLLGDRLVRTNRLATE